MAKVRLAVIGTGMAWERLHWPAIQQLSDKYEIVALCNRTRKDAERFASIINLDLKNVYDDYNEMLQRNDIDAVDVLVPIPDNFEVAAAVLKANKNLIAEKPLAATLEGAQELLQLHKEHPVHFMVAENYRYNEENNIIRDIISQGKIGQVIYFIKNNMVDFETEMKGNTFAATEWRQYPEYKGGTFLDAGIHDIAALRHIFGEVEHVYALGRPQQEPFSPYMSINVQMLFRSGVIGQYTYCSEINELQKPLIGLRIFGTLGEIYLEDKKSGIIHVTYKDGNSEQIQFTPDRGYYNELLNFYNALNGTESILATPEVEYGDLKTVFDVLKSIEDNKLVKVDNINWKLESNYENAQGRWFLQ